VKPIDILAARRVERDIDDEIRLHLELLAESYRDQGMRPDAAYAKALERFGDIEQVRQQCVLIDRRQRKLPRAIKAILLGVFVIGIGVRISTSDLYVGQLGTMLIVIALSGSLWMYLRSHRPVDRAPIGTFPPTEE
jgi:hypothetical protein